MTADRVSIPEPSSYPHMVQVACICLAFLVGFLLWPTGKEGNHE